MGVRQYKPIFILLYFSRIASLLPQQGKKSSGSDFHASTMLISGGIETEHPITTREELLEALKSEDLRLLTDYDKVP